MVQHHCYDETGAIAFDDARGVVIIWLCFPIRKQISLRLVTDSDCPAIDLGRAMIVFFVFFSKQHLCDYKSDTGKYVCCFLADSGAVGSESSRLTELVAEIARHSWLLFSL